MREITRREFIISGAAALTFSALPGFGKVDRFGHHPFDETQPVQHLDETGASLLLYFVNVTRKGGHLVPRDRNNSSYSIVQTPPQSLHEQYFYSAENLPPAQQLPARLSGPSFLVFRLWPKFNHQKKLPAEWRIPYNINAFLNWHNSDQFALQTASDVPHKDWKPLSDFAAVKSVSLRDSEIGGLYDLTYYRNLIATVLNRNSKAQISILELPAGMLMTMIDPTTGRADRLSSAVSNVQFRVTQNRSLRNDAKTIRQLRFEWRRDRDRVIRTVAERWSAEITVLPRTKTPTTAGISELPPALRAIGLVRTRQISTSTDTQRVASCAIDTSDCGIHLDKDRYLPTLATEAELVFLNQLGSGQFADPKFDIHSEGPFRLTDLGGSLRLHYKNYDTAGLPGNVSLVEYEHIFEAGRDNYIKVARIGICPKTTLRMLHLAIAERKIRGGVSYVDYKEYCDWLDIDRDFPDKPGKLTLEYDSPIEPRIDTKWLRHPFSHVEAVVGRQIPILPVLNDTGCKNPDSLKADPTFLDPRAFWVYREGVGTDRSEISLLPYPHKFHDRNGKSLGVVDTAVLFLRRDFFACPDLIRRWLGNDSTVQSLKMSAWDDGRHRIALRGQVVALTPNEERAPSSSGITSTDTKPPDSLANRPNQMATDWVECYFDTARKPSAFDEDLFPVFPQMRQARVYIDHVQQYARSKRASIVEYATDYLDSRYEAANKVKVVIAHTQEFMANAVTTLGNRNIEVLDPDLPGAWNALKQTFRGAAESLGALVNPDPALECISLTKSALSLPTDSINKINLATQKITLNPRDLFKSVDAQLFAGIRLSDILGILDLDEAPQYLLTKLPLASSSAEILAAIANDPIVQRAYDAATNFQQKVQELKQLYDTAQATLEHMDAEVRHLRASVDQALPTRSKIEAAARDQFEAAIGQFANFGCETPECVERLRSIAALEVLRFLKDSGANLPTVDVIAFLNDTADKAAAKLLAEYATISPNSPRYLELKAQYDGFSSKVQEVKDWYGDIKSTIERPDFDSPAIKALAAKLTLDSSGKATRLAELTGRVFKLYELVKSSVTSQDTIWRDALAKLDAARRLNVKYLKDRMDRMLRDADDACRTLPPSVFAVVGTFEDAKTCGSEYATKLSQLWTTNPESAMKLVQDRGERYSCIETVASKAISQLLPKGTAERLATAQENLRKQVSEVQNAVDSWKRAATEEAQSLSDRFNNEFQAELEKVTSTETVGSAIATYARVKRLLDSVRVQDVATEWATTRFEAADLGFLRFEPRAPGETKLSMHAGIHMEMDPLSQPPLPVRTDASAETRITAFRITFLQVIGVDFDSVNFSAGTGKATHADVKVASVNFAGSLSFIQALQSLLASLVDGLRVDLGANDVTVGYQSPSLDLSAPGFTFSNFFVGVALVIPFDGSPVRLRFSLADVERKATIAAGVYGGSFFCALTMDTKRGVIGTDSALELGAYFGIRFGPFGGFVKFMVGLRYTRDDEGVTLIGYFIAQGLLSVWVVSVSARLYMGVISHNSVTEGFCIASYTFKIGFIKKTFESGYSKRIAGATQNSANSGRHSAALHNLPSSVSALYTSPDTLSVKPTNTHRQKGVDGPIDSLRRLMDKHPEILADQFEPLRGSEFTRFIKSQFATLD